MSSTGSAHDDRFLLDRLPPPALRPDTEAAAVALGLPARLNTGEALFAEHAVRRPDAPAVISPDAAWSYGELERAVACIAGALNDELGLAPGKRVLLHGPNEPSLLAAILGVLRAGMVAVPTVPLLQPSELAIAVRAVEPDLILCHASATVGMDALATERGSPALHRYGTPDGVIERALEREGVPADPVATARDDPAIILLSSGSTGAPAVTVHTHGDILSVVRSFGRHVFRAGPGDVIAGSPSLAFAYGFGLLLACPLAAGATVYLHPERGIEALADMFAHAGPTMLVTAPTAYRKLLARPALPEHGRLRRCFSAGEALPEAVFERWHAATGVPILDVLGSTEMLGPYVASPEEERRAGRIGRAVPGYEARVLDARGRSPGIDAPGRLAVRGPTGVCYLDHEAQARAVHEGWTLTGDICRIDADGYVAFEGRADDIVVSAGYNISVVEVENVLAEHPDVLECAVTALPDAERGRSVVALVVPREETPAPDALERSLIAHLRGRLAAYKLPRRVIAVEVLPKTASGKLRRAALGSILDKEIE